jgi:hypothetical protein
MTTKERILSSCFLIIGSLQLLSAQEWQLVWSDEFNREAALPMRYEIDYVRIYGSV